MRAAAAQAGAKASRLALGLDCERDPRGAPVRVGGDSAVVAEHAACPHHPRDGDAWFMGDGGTWLMGGGGP